MANTTTQTDRELFELAAKAAAIEFSHWSDGTEPYSSGQGLVLATNAIWNPRDKDGDSFRLAVALGLYQSHGDDGVFVDLKDNEGRYYLSQAKWRGAREEYGNDPCAATRLAIFLAAVEIGRAMP